MDLSTAALEAPFRQYGREPLHCVEPGRRGRGEVVLESGVTVQPLLDLGMLVNGVVVEDQVDDPVRRGLAIYRAEETDEVLMAGRAGSGRGPGFGW